MAKKAEKDYFHCEITRPLYSSKMKLEDFTIGNRFYIEGDNDLFIRTDKKVNDKIICVNEHGKIYEFHEKQEVVFIHGIQYTFLKLSSLIVNDVKNDGKLLFRTDLYPD